VPAHEELLSSLSPHATSAAGVITAIAMTATSVRRMLPRFLLKFAGTSCLMDARDRVLRPGGAARPVTLGPISEITKGRANVFSVADERR
jgi:hypothetical protein